MNLPFWPFQKTVELYAFRPAFEGIEEKPLATEALLAHYRRLGYRIRIVEPPFLEQPYRNAKQIGEYLKTRKHTEPIVLGYLARGQGGSVDTVDAWAYERLTEEMYHDLARWVDEQLLPEARKVANGVEVTKHMNRAVLSANGVELWIHPAVYQRMYRSADILARRLQAGPITG